MPDPHKTLHLRQIRSILRRMTLVSLIMKSWSVLTALTILFISTTGQREHWLWLAIFTTILFWLVDAHSLRQVRLFRKNQERVERLTESQIDFDMSTDALDSDAEALSSTLLSPSIAVFYCAILGSVVAFSIGLWRL